MKRTWKWLGALAVLGVGVSVFLLRHQEEENPVPKDALTVKVERGELPSRSRGK